MATTSAYKDTLEEHEPGEDVQVYQQKIRVAGRIRTLRNQIIELKNKKVEKTRAIDILKQRLEVVDQRIQHEIDEYANIQRCEESKELLRKVFSDRQISMLLNNKKTTLMGDDEHAFAYTILKNGNQHFYNYLMNHLNFPLPGWRRSLRWANTRMKKIKSKNDND